MHRRFQNCEYKLRNTQFEILLSKVKVGFPDAFADPAYLLQTKCIKDFKIAQQKFVKVDIF
jgi:hypothetical protein